MTYTAMGDLAISQQVNNEAVVMPPAGINDPDLSNNRATAHTQSGGYRVLLPLVLKNYQP